jgi:hypothetical protein
MRQHRWFVNVRRAYFHRESALFTRPVSTFNIPSFAGAQTSIRWRRLAYGTFHEPSHRSPLQASITPGGFRRPVPMEESMLMRKFITAVARLGAL